MARVCRAIFGIRDCYVAIAEIQSGACGFVTVVKANATGSRKVELSIESACPQVKKLAESLSVVDVYKELSCRHGASSIIAAGMQYCTHAACPVPCGIVKAVEVAAGLAVASDVTIHITKEG
jgi:hypothetical protein